MSDDDRVYKLEELQERLGVHRATITKWIKAGMFPNAYKINPFGKSSPFRIPERDIRAFERARENMYGKDS